MFIHKLTIGNRQVENNILLAPMAGYTDYAIRNLQIKLGIGLAFTELVSAKGLMFGGEGSKNLLYSGEETDKTAVQLFGSEEEYMQRACESEYLSDFDIIDINMGCPVPKVFKNGEGSALLTDIKKAEKIVKACVKSNKNITVKIRTGQKQGDDVALDFCKMAEFAGAKLVTIHGRVREAYYSGEPDYKAIEKAKNAVNIPIIANGGIFTLDEADKMIERTGADGVMLARGAIADPFLVNKLLNTQPVMTKKEYILEHIKLMKNQYGDRRATLEWRKFVPYYFKGINGVKELKLKLQQAQNVKELIEIIESEV